ncbi:hypothetical protein CEP54_002468 [Fusarium duplospermum]|uniref:Helicase ATP-binding domain-containing protein n=1 Tax=Fusarium duplospermum TaxID=1325734 RepID=A0A428QV73_9HYPO|nr:hypothetical protein CEP54_002468 [Fusarium duplospermum]
MVTLHTTPISRAAARQRDGRAGRIQDGTCYRLYNKDLFDKTMMPNTPPGMLTSEVMAEVLTLKSCGFHKISDFNFVDAPNVETVLRLSTNELRALEYIDDDGKLTKNGSMAVGMPVDPAWYNAFLKAKELGCLAEVVTIACLLSMQDDADVIQQQCSNAKSDHLTRLNAFHIYIHRRIESAGDEDNLARWCRMSFINPKVAEQARKMRNIMMASVSKRKLNNEPVPALEPSDPDFGLKIRQSLAVGFYHKAAHVDRRGTYKTNSKMLPKTLFLADTQHSTAYFASLRSRRAQFPVCSPEKRQEFLNCYHSRQVTIAVGDTGCGKTTQLLQLLLFDEWSSQLVVGCTQPRKIAVSSVAARVASEMEVPLGGVMGYQFRDENTSTANTRLKFLTDDLLLQQLRLSRGLREYACIVVDETHERTGSTDMTLALLKHVMEYGDDFKVMVMSATVNVEKFTQYFNTQNVFRAPGQACAVQIQYLKEATPNYLTCVYRLVEMIVKNKPKGDILLFLTTTREVEETCAMIRRRVPGLRVLPLYSALQSEAQSQAMGKSKFQQCIISANVAEATA